MSDRMSRDSLAVTETGVDEDWKDWVDWNDWLDQLDAYDVASVVLDLRSDGDLVEIFRRQPSWTVDFEDGEAVIFLRNAPRTARL